MAQSLVLETSVPEWPVRRGKVRDIYDLGDRLLLVSTDRISAYDWVLPTGIPDKGRILTELSAFWFDRLGERHHLLSTTLDGIELPPSVHLDQLEGRSMVVRKTKVVPIECVVRGYLSGSGWRAYQKEGAICGISLPSGLVQSCALEQPIFTPATKAETGHDENISFGQMVEVVGQDVAEELRERSLAIYARGAEHARQKGIIVADTKFEWGWDGSELILIDEVLTPDSSRFWPADEYQPGAAPPSFDKQFVRDWLDTTDWDKASTPPELPAEIVAKTSARYQQALEQITGGAT